jgi:hypothetical protein
MGTVKKRTRNSSVESGTFQESILTQIVRKRMKNCASADYHAATHATVRIDTGRLF